MTSPSRSSTDDAAAGSSVVAVNVADVELAAGTAKVALLGDWPRLARSSDVQAASADSTEADAAAVRLDDLEALVDERGGVDRDDRPHRPRRVLERLLHGDVGEVVASAPAERTARRGQHETAYVAGRAGAQALGGEGSPRVLVVDRESVG